MSTTTAVMPTTPDDYAEDTAPEIRAYLASVRPLRGAADLACEEEYQRGRSLIERLANSTRGQGTPTLPLSPADCADILYFVRSSEPVVPRAWWKDPDDEPSHLVGFCVVLEAVERSLRAKVRS